MRPPEPPQINKSTVTAGKPKAELSEQTRLVKVHIKGTGINKPGTYRLAADSRVLDLVKKAGGLKESAVTEAVPWQRKVYENLALNIPSRKALKQAKEGQKALNNQDLITFRKLEPESQENNLIDINRAAASQLETLPGIGKVLAERIVENRTKNGNFKQKRDITRVRGIGEGKFKQLKPLVSAGYR